MNIPKRYRTDKYEVIHFDEIDSTNEYAWNLISNSNPSHNVVIIAENQTNGKGQYGRKWEADIGENITMTAVVSPNELHIKDAFHLNMIVSLAIIEAIESCIDCQLTVKWPNDIYHNENKLCGILIKNKVVENKIKRTIIGIGINVNQKVFSPNIPNPTSLSIISQERKDKNSLIQKVLKNLYSNFDKVAQMGIATFLSEYNIRLFRKGKEARYEINNEEKALTIKKVNASGVLHLEGRDGSTFELSSGLKYIL